jgi:DNA-binding response OmpR family regulator
VVDATILSLRSKLESNPAKPKYIKTIRGFGYRFGPVD